jgi:dihydropteroate synthase
MTAIGASYRFRIGGVDFDFHSRTYVMGILNVTPDSFSDGGRFIEASKAVERGIEMVGEGADIIDVGGESTRPGSEPVSPDQEIERVVPVIEKLRRSVSVPLSIDTCKAVVADAALKAGASMVNDISGLSADKEMVNVARLNGATVVLMHIQGTPKTMQQAPQYQDVVKEVYGFLENQINMAHTHGIMQVIVDPGIGFGKNLEHNLEVMKSLQIFSRLGCPVLVGPSRKSFIGKLLDLPVEDRVEGTAAAVAACILRGANIVRVHDVKQMKRVAVVSDALKGTVATL